MKNTLITLTILIGFLFAENPTLNVQGVLRDENGTAVPDGENYQLTFYLYEATEGSSSIWSEDHTGVSVINGVYSAELGGASSLGGLTFATPYYLGIAVNGGTESTPRIPLSMSPYALSVRGTTNTFPNDGDVIMGSEAHIDNYWHFQNTNELNTDGTMFLNYGGNDVDISHTGGTTSVGGDLNVNGDVTINGNTPFLIRSYHFGSHWNVNWNTEVSIDDWSAVITGISTGWIDVAESGGHNGPYYMMEPYGDTRTWHIKLNGPYHNDPPDWTVHVMFIRRELVTDERNEW